MITCKEIDDYLRYAKEPPKWFNRDRKLLIRNIVKPTLKRKDIWFDEETFRRCIAYIEANYYSLFPYQKFVIAFTFFYTTADNEPVFPEIVILSSVASIVSGIPETGIPFSEKVTRASSTAASMPSASAVSVQVHSPSRGSV